MKVAVRVGGVFAAMAIPAFVLSVTLANPALAKSKGPDGKITCTSLTGSATGSATLSGCTGTKTAADAGGGGATIPAAASLEAGGTVKWNNGDTTSFNSPTVTGTSAKKCPAAYNSSAEKFKGTVTSDNTGVKVPGKFSGEICLSNTGSFVNKGNVKVS